MGEPPGAPGRVRQVNDARVVRQGLRRIVNTEIARCEHGSRISGGYETSDLSRLMSRLGKHIPASNT